MAHRAKLRRTALEERANALGLCSQTDQARKIGVAPSIHHRALHGKRELSGPYVLGVLWAFGGPVVRQALNELFEFNGNLEQVG